RAISKDVYIFPGSVWPTKRWSEEGFAQVGSKLTEDGYQVYWMGSPAEADLCRALAQQVPASVSLAGQLNLNECLNLLKNGRLLISNDSGSMHMGSVAGIPTVAIFGPT